MGSIRCTRSTVTRGRVVLGSAVTGVLAPIPVDRVPARSVYPFNRHWHGYALGTLDSRGHYPLDFAFPRLPART
jgi:hypothetical protein